MATGFYADSATNAIPLFGVLRDKKVQLGFFAKWDIWYYSDKDTLVEKKKNFRKGEKSFLFTMKMPILVLFIFLYIQILFIFLYVFLYICTYIYKDKNSYKTKIGICSLDVNSSYKNASIFQKSYDFSKQLFKYI